MTLIVGYIHSDSTIHLIADSAETIIDLNNQSSSTNQNKKSNSFGEIIEKNDGKIVLESLQKIYNISDTILITFSGVSIEGNQVLEDLKLEINISKNIKTSEIISKYFELRKPTLTEYIIAFNEDDLPKIYYYKEKGEFLTKKGKCIILGSGSENELITIPLICSLKEFYNVKLHRSNLLVSIIALVQCCALNAMSFKNGVGGFFNGAAIFNNKVYWSSDTCNILYSSKHFEKSERFMVNKYNRENVTLLASSKIGKAVYFPGLEWIDFTTNQWAEKWIKKLVKLHSNCDTHYFIFICYDRRIITVLNKESKRFNENLKIIQVSEENAEFSLSKNFIEKLLSYPLGPETGKESYDGFGVQINYIS